MSNISNTVINNFPPRTGASEPVFKPDLFLNYLKQKKLKHWVHDAVATLNHVDTKSCAQNLSHVLALKFVLETQKEPYQSMINSDDPDAQCAN